MAYSQEELNSIVQALIIDNTTNQITPAKVRTVFEAVISSLAVTDAATVTAEPPLYLDAFTNVFSILQANAETNGYLSKEDWAIFSSSTSKFKGVYPTFAALVSAHPTATAGDYAQVNEVGATDVVNYNWDAEESIWVLGGGSMIGNTDSLPEGSANLYFTAARVLATLLTGISFVTNTAITATDSILTAFGKLQAQITYLFTKIPSNYSQLVYVNATSPTTATIFDLNNPPVTNDNSLKNNVDNLYVATDSSTWVYNAGTSTYVTKVIVNNLLNQIEVSGNQTTQLYWNGKEVTFMSSGLHTIPNSLPDQFSFDLAADIGVTITWAITSPFTWRVSGLEVGVAPPSMTAGQFCTVSRRIGTNEIRVRGL